MKRAVLECMGIGLVLSSNLGWIERSEFFIGECERGMSISVFLFCIILFYFNGLQRIPEGDR